LTSLVSALAEASGLELTAYREDHVRERVRRALAREAASTAEELVGLLRTNGSVRERFRRSIAVSVSGLFRDPAQFELLEREIVPALVENAGRIRVWSAGCADGSELYSVALVLERLGVLDRAFLLGSDLLEENLAVARRGVYGDTAISSTLRARARWEQRNIVKDGAPPGRWRLVLCRNLAIYLSPAAKLALHRTLAEALAPGGVVIVGRSERINDPASLGLARIAPHAYRRVA
jgi:chemotaxis protein methyltransferase CheR